jgi:hypothetical protein
MKKCKCGAEIGNRFKYCSDCAEEARNKTNRKFQQSLRDNATPEQKQAKKERQRRWRLKRYYGITEDDYNNMFIKQNGCCRICGKHQTELIKKFHIDHCHTTGVVRGLLCSDCNMSLGKFEDSIDILQRAIDYLKETMGDR